MTINVFEVVSTAIIVALIVASFAVAKRRRDAGYGVWRPLPGILLGVIGLTFGGTMFAFADSDRQAFASDPGCIAGVVSDSRHASACRTASAYITRWYWTSGRHSTQHLVVRTADGTQVDVQYGKSRTGNLWHYLLYPGGRNATLQYFRNDIVQVQTRYGYIATTAAPTERFNQWALFSIVAGIVGVFCALQASRHGFGPPISGPVY